MNISIKDFEKYKSVIIAVLSVLVIILIAPILIRMYHGATSKDYEPWDPDNINVIKDQIKKLNSEAEQIEIELGFLPNYELDISQSWKNINSVQLDSPYVSTLVNIQPNSAIVNIELYVDIDFNSPAANAKISRTLLTQILNKRAAYSKEYTSLVNGLGYNIINPYYEGSGTLRISDFYVAKSIEIPGVAVDSGRFSRQEILPLMKDASSKFGKSKIFLLETIGALDTILKKRISLLEQRKAQLKPEQDKLKEEFNKKNFNINQYAVVIGIPFFIIAALLMYWYGLRSNKNSNSGTDKQEVDPKDKLAFALNTITVLLLILSLLILGLAKVIAENTLAALLGTIGGYVLNNAKTKEGGATNGAPKPAPPAGPAQPVAS